MVDELGKVLPDNDMEAPREQPDNRIDNQPDTDGDSKDLGQVVPRARINTIIDPVYQPGLDDPLLPLDSLPNFEYGPPLPEGYIRILMLMPPTQEDEPEELNWALVCDTLSNAQKKYSAVSYTWGYTSKTHRIRCNGKSLAVTENVHDALKHLVCLFDGNFGVKGTPALWIDAVCINQQNFAERKEQVKMMKDIYKAAQMTFVWLPVGRGISDEDLEKIDKGFTSMVMLQEMYYVQQFRDMLHNGKISLDTLDHIKFGEKELRVPGANRDGITKLFTQPWFERIWICQEIAVSGSAAVFDGKHIAPWGLFADSAEVVHHLGGLDNVKTWTSDEVAHDKTFVGNIRRLERLRKSATQETPIGLLELLHATANFQSTEPLDRVYGLLGLITDGRDREIVTSFLDYNNSPYLLYLNITVNHIVQHQTLDILHLIGPVKTDPAGNWLSIVPNLAASHNHNRGLGTFKSRDEWIYHASLDTKPGVKVNGEVPEPGEIIKLTDGDEISLSGVVLDKVTRVSKMLDSAGMSMTSMMTWFETAMFEDAGSRFIPGAMLTRHLEYLTKRERKMKGLPEGGGSERGKVLKEEEDEVGGGGEKEGSGETTMSFRSEGEEEKDEKENIDKEILKLLEPLVKYDEKGKAFLPGMEEKPEQKASLGPEDKRGSLPSREKPTHSEEPPNDKDAPTETTTIENGAGASSKADSKKGDSNLVDDKAAGNNTSEDISPVNNPSDNATPTTAEGTKPPHPSTSNTNNASTPPPEKPPSGIGSHPYPLPPHESYNKSFFLTLLHNISPLSPSSPSSDPNNLRNSAPTCPCPPQEPDPLTPTPCLLPSSSLSTIFKDYYIPWLTLLQSHDGDSFNHAWMREWYKEHATHEGTKPVTTFANWVEDCQLGRRMFRTEKGWIGTSVDGAYGTEGVHEGDLVVLLRGGQTLYIVRKVKEEEEGVGKAGVGETVTKEEESVTESGGVKDGEKEGKSERPGREGVKEGNKYKFVGAAYVHGLMEGEGMGLGVGVEEEFVFV